MCFLTTNLVLLKLLSSQKAKYLFGLCKLKLKIKNQ